MVKNGNAMPCDIFTLPGGYRPTASEVFPVQSANALARLDVRADGTVRISNGSTNWISISGVSFKTN